MKDAVERQLKFDLEQAFNSIGHSMMSETRAQQLLAFVYVLGGGYEAVTLHTGLNTDIVLAAKKFGVEGGQAPDGRLLAPLLALVAELERTRWATPWVAPLLEQYGIRAPTK